jgi:hypothetical protein
MGLLDWLKNLFGGGKKEEQSQEGSTGAPEQSAGVQDVSSENQGETSPESGEEERPQQ